MPVQLIAIALTLLGCLAAWRNPEAALAWIILLPMLINRHPWWLERKNIAPADIPVTVAGLLAILTVAIRLPLFSTFFAYTLALLCVIIRAAQLYRKGQRPIV